MHHVRYTEVMCNKWDGTRKERSSEDKESNEATFCKTERRKQGMNWRWHSGACLKFSYQASLRRNLLCGVNGPYHSRLAGSRHRSSVLDLLSFLVGKGYREGVRERERRVREREGERERED